MNIYTNGDQIQFFKTNKFVDDLTPIKIEGFEDAISKYPNIFTLGVLVGQQSLCIDDDDEITLSENPAPDDVEVLDVPFIKGMTYSQIAEKYISSSEKVANKIIMATELMEWFPNTDIWEGDLETISLDMIDGGVLTVVINHDDVTVTAKLETAGG